MVQLQFSHNCPSSWDSQCSFSLTPSSPLPLLPFRIVASPTLFYWSMGHLVFIALLGSLYSSTSSYKSSQKSFLSWFVAMGPTLGMLQDLEDSGRIYSFRWKERKTSGFTLDTRFFVFVREIILGDYRNSALILLCPERIVPSVITPASNCLLRAIGTGVYRARVCLLVRESLLV